VRFIVLCGISHNPPQRIVGPFESHEEASRFAQGQPGAPSHYAVVDVLTPPDAP
jgi:hypothetical protein